MGALKALVIVMGLAIIVATAVLVTLIVERGTRLASGAGTPQAPAALDLPAGTQVLETRLDGGRIALRARLAGGGEALFLFDAETAGLIRRFDIAPAAPLP